jgi:hypothetical protein
VEYKLEALESAIKSHRQTMKDLEKLALDDDNRISDMALQELLQNAESEMAAGSNSLMGSCSSSVGIDKQASSGVNVCHLVGWPVYRAEVGKIFGEWAEA